jgi:hypothetical protein
MTDGIFSGPLVGTVEKVTIGDKQSLLRFKEQSSSFLPDSRDQGYLFYVVGARA